MSLSSAEERALAEMEQELAGDDRLVSLVARLNRLAQRRSRFRLPVPELGWIITLLVSGLGIALLIAGVLSGRPGAIEAGCVVAVLFQIPAVTLAMLTHHRRPRR